MKLVSTDLYRITVRLEVGTLSLPPVLKMQPKYAAPVGNIRRLLIW